VVTIFQNYQVFAGSAPDTTPAQFEINPAAMRIDIAVFDNTLLIALGPDLTRVGAPLERLAGTVASLDCLVRRFTVVNKTVASIARFNIIAFYDPIEITGRPFVRPL
jgi:hypothetical protein